MITKNQKMLLGVGVVAVAGYLVYQQMNKKSYANASGRGIFGRRTSTKSCGPGNDCTGARGNLCGESCMNGVCNFIIYGEDGKPQTYAERKCD